MSEFCSGRSNSSKDMRDSLMATQSELPTVRAAVALGRYIDYAYNLFKIALATNTQEYISRTYVAWKRFLTFIANVIPQHPKYRVSDSSTEKFKKWSKEASCYAFSELENIVAQMDREEDAAREEVTDGELQCGETDCTRMRGDSDFLLDEFDGMGGFVPSTFSAPASPSVCLPIVAAPKHRETLPPTGSATAGANRLQVLELECNSQLGHGPRDSGSSLYDMTASAPALDAGPGPSISLLGISPTDRLILLYLLGSGAHDGVALRNIPPPQRLLLQLKFSTSYGLKQIAFHRHDFYISFLRFFQPPGGWGQAQQQLKNSRQAMETNRCFFIHLGIAINVHPFALQSYFRHVAATIVATSQDDLQKEIIQSVLQYAGFVDANSLLYIWPQEMQRCRVCLISGDLGKPIFCTFFPANVADVDSLDDVIIHSDGSHFTLLKPAVAENSASFSVLSKLLAVAKSAGCIVQDIPVDVEGNKRRNMLPDSIHDVFATALQ